MFAAVVLLIVMGLSSTASHVPTHSAINVQFSADGTDFVVTTIQGLSNIQIEFCVGPNEKIEFQDDLTSYTYTGSVPIVGVWIKSGDNGIVGNDPPGAGERTDNVSVVCDTVTTTATTSVTTTTTETTPTTPSTATTTPATTHTTATSPTAGITTGPTSPGTTTPSTTEIPVFPSSAALALGVIGSLGGAMVIMRRRGN